MLLSKQILFPIVMIWHCSAESLTNFGTYLTLADLEGHQRDSGALSQRGGGKGRVWAAGPRRSQRRFLDTRVHWSPCITKTCDEKRFLKCNWCFTLDIDHMRAPYTRISSWWSTWTSFLKLTFILLFQSWLKAFFRPGRPCSRQFWLCPRIHGWLRWISETRLRYPTCWHQRGEQSWVGFKTDVVR